MIHRGIVATGLLTHRASGLGRVGVGVGIGTVHNPQAKTILQSGCSFHSCLLKGLQTGVNEATTDKIIVVIVIEVPAQRVAAGFSQGHTAALVGGAGELASAGHSAGGGLATAPPTVALGEGAALTT